MTLTVEKSEEVTNVTVPKVRKNKKAMAVTQPKRLHLRELLAKEQPIWVLNNTVEIAKKFKCKPGTVTLQVGEGETRDRALIPPGNDPICLSDQVDSESLKKCRDLFRAIDRGALVLLDPEKADQYYARNSARRSIVEQKIDNERSQKQEDIPIPEKAAESAVEIDPGMIDICLSLKHPAENVSEPDRIRNALERLEERAGTYTDDDLNYLLNNGKFAPIKAWAKKELKKLQPDEE